MTTADSAGAYTVDASVVISYLDTSEPHHEEAQDLLEALVGEDLWMNPITMAEVLVGYARGGRLGEGRQMLSELGVEERPLARDAAWRLAALRAATALKLPDCCVLLTAEETDSAVASLDERLRQAAARRGVAVIP